MFSSLEVFFFESAFHIFNVSGLAKLIQCLREHLLRCFCIIPDSLYVFFQKFERLTY
jgi:hypothetical protein